MISQHQPEGFESPEMAFARNMRAKREALGWSQERLARAMADLGFKWHQATVYSIEKGERRVQLNEAVIVAQLMSTTVGSLVAQPDHALAMAFWAHINADFRSALKALEAAAQKYEEARQALESYLDEDGRVLLSEGTAEDLRLMIKGLTAADVAAGNISPELRLWLTVTENSVHIWGGGHGEHPKT